MGVFREGGGAKGAAAPLQISDAHTQTFKKEIKKEKIMGEKGKREKDERKKGRKEEKKNFFEILPINKKFL